MIVVNSWFLFFIQMIMHTKWQCNFDFDVLNLGILWHPKFSERTIRIYAIYLEIWKKLFMLNFGQWYKPPLWKDETHYLKSTKPQLNIYRTSIDNFTSFCFKFSFDRFWLVRDTDVVLSFKTRCEPTRHWSGVIHHFGQGFIRQWKIDHGRIL